MKDEAMTTRYALLANAALDRACAYFAIPREQIVNNDEAQAVMLLYLDDRLGHLEAHS